MLNAGNHERCGGPIEGKVFRHQISHRKGADAFGLLHGLGPVFHLQRHRSECRFREQRLQVIVFDKVVTEAAGGIHLHPADGLSLVSQVRFYGCHAQHVNGGGRGHLVANSDQRFAKPFPILLLGLLSALFVEFDEMSAIEGKRWSSQ